MFSTLVGKTTDTLFLGFRHLTASSEIQCITNIPYGELPRQTLDIYLPSQLIPESTVVFIHGGGWRSGNKENYAFIGQQLARLGMNCVVINYRLFPETQYPGFVYDAAQALRWLEQSGIHYGIDSELPVFLMGHSAGAHISMLAVLDQNIVQNVDFSAKRIKGIIGLAGVYSFRPENSPLYQKIFFDIL